MAILTASREDLLHYLASVLPVTEPADSAVGNTILLLAAYFAVLCYSAGTMLLLSVRHTWAQALRFLQVIFVLAYTLPYLYGSGPRAAEGGVATHMLRLGVLYLLLAINVFVLFGKKHPQKLS